MNAAEKMAVELLKQLQHSGDVEVAHAEADKVLADLLSSLGYTEVVAEWEKVEKWYA